MSTTGTAAKQAPDFTDVMAALRGRKLAVYDLLIRGGIMSTTTVAATLRKEGSLEQIETELEWLRQHHFIRRCSESPVRWEPRSRSYAEQQYLSRGVLVPATNATFGVHGIRSADKASARPDALPEPQPTAPPPRAVHTQQSTWW